MGRRWSRKEEGGEKGRGLGNTGRRLVFRPGLEGGKAPLELQILSIPANENLPVPGTHLVIHPIQQSWDYRKDGGAESLHVI